MRGRPKDPAKAKAKARAHATRAHFCSCGRRVFGNGGKAAHEGMHARKEDGGRWIRFEEWKPQFSCYRDDDSVVCKGTCGGECQRFIDRRRSEGAKMVNAAFSRSAKVFPKNLLSDRTWELVFKARCKSKRGQELTPTERSLVDEAYESDPERYRDMEPAVFDATVPFGSTRKWGDGR